MDLSAQLTETLRTLLVERKKETLRNGWGEVPDWVFITPTQTRKVEQEGRRADVIKIPGTQLDPDNFPQAGVAQDPG